MENVHEDEDRRVDTEKPEEAETSLTEKEDSAPWDEQPSEQSAEEAEESEAEKKEEPEKEEPEKEETEKEETTSEAEIPSESVSGAGESKALEEEGTEEAEPEEAEPEKKKSHKKVIIAAAAIVAVAAAVAYVGVAQRYSTVFFPGTEINNIDVSGLSLPEVKDKLAAGVSDYSLKIITAEGEDEELYGQDIGLTVNYDDSMSAWLDEQNPYLWGLHLFQNTDITIDTMISYDEDLMEQKVKELSFMDPSSMTEPVNAYISSYNEETGGYEIIPDVPGTIPDTERLFEVLGESVCEMLPEINLSEAGVYVPADITSDNPELLARLDEFNKYAEMTVIYHFGGNDEILDGSLLNSWLAEEDDGTISVDRDAVAEYVKYLADKYDTVSQPKELKTTYGPTVTITKGTYGWKIAQSKETDALIDIIVSGQGEEREPIYQQTAASRGDNDYGDTYVEINLTAQHLYYYKNGSLVIESDLVSGKESNGNATPDGAYPIAYKQRDRVLRGERLPDGTYEYESPVSYWMPFNGGIGLHDATWRGSFGGNIYKTNGSHGCINLPFSVAKTIYENIDTGCPVLCYRLGSVEPAKTASSSSSTASSAARSSTSSKTAVVAAAEQETVPAITQIEETLPVTEVTEVLGETQSQPTSGSGGVIVAGQSKGSQGPGAVKETEAAPVIEAGSGTALEAVSVETQPETQAAQPETQAAQVETQAEQAETQAAPAAVEVAPAAPANEAVSMEAPGA